MRNAVDWGQGPGTLFWQFDEVLPEGSMVYDEEDIIFIDDVAYFVGRVSGQTPAVQLGKL